MSDSAWFAVPRPTDDDRAQAFDLNIEKVLEHWPIAFALR